MVSCQEPSPLKGSKHSLQHHPHDAALVNAHSFVSMGVEAKVSPLPQRCTLPVHEEATLPLLLSSLPWPLPLQLSLPSLLPSTSTLPLPLLLPLLSPLPIAVTVAIGHYRCNCPCPLLLLSPLRCCQPSPLLSPLPSSIAISITVSHCSPHIHWPSPLPSPSAIAKSCCLGAARVVFEQLKQIMLTLFYFVLTLGSTLFKSWWLTRRWAAMANTSVGRQAASSEQLVEEVAGSRGAARWRRCLTMGGVVLLCCWGGSHWQMAFVMMCWMW